MLVFFGRRELFIGVGILYAILLTLWWRKRKPAYLLFFSLFWLYLLLLVSVVVYPFEVNLAPGSYPEPPKINLIPFHESNCGHAGSCVLETVGNVLLTVPFGFGISFLLKLKPRTVPWVALSLGVGIELQQLVMSLILRSDFRTVDINDALLNALGVLLGYALFRLFARGYVRSAQVLGFRDKWLLRDIYEVAQRAEMQDIAQAALSSQ